MIGRLKVLVLAKEVHSIGKIGPEAAEEAPVEPGESRTLLAIAVGVMLALAVLLLLLSAVG